MTTSPRQNQDGYSLRTLGPVALSGAGNPSAIKLRKKDLGLLVYLCVEGAGARSRVFLSSLLWGDRPQARARHSLTQAVGRLRSILGGNQLVARAEQIQWYGPLACDARSLERAYSSDSAVRRDFIYSGDFLTDFHIGTGADEFELWVEQRRTRYRSMALHVLEGMGALAESRGHWAEALELGRRSVEIEALYEAGHRRIMRSLAALGERGLALNHYGEFALWLREQVDLPPDPATSFLAQELKLVGSADDDDDPAHYVPISEPDLRADGRAFLAGSLSQSRDSRPGPFTRLSRMVREVGIRTAGWRNGLRSSN